MNKLLHAVAVSAATFAWRLRHNHERKRYGLGGENYSACRQRSDDKHMQCDSTPCSLKMARNAEFDATITKPGYKTLHVHVTHKIATAGGAGMAGNVLLGGIIGAGVDVATGAMYDLTLTP